MLLITANSFEAVVMILVVREVDPNLAARFQAVEESLDLEIVSDEYLSISSFTLATQQDAESYSGTFCRHGVG